MNKTDLIMKVSEKQNIPVKAATTIVGTLFDCMIEPGEGGTD